MEKGTLTRCQKIVLYGPESTGKTTLAKALANHYNTLWVPEFARDYLQKKWEDQRAKCDLDDLLIIAREQAKAETEAAKNAHRFLFCDTNVLVTKVWSETHFDGYCAPALLRMAEQVQDVHYFLTNIDVPWEADDLRDRPDQRDEMFHYFQKQLVDQGLPHTLLLGDHSTRLQQAIDTLEDLFPLPLREE